MCGSFHRFNLPTLQSSLPNEQSNHVISKLHGILKPFLLRRLKADVEHSLPPKKEYVLYAPLSEEQREIYNAVVTGALRRYLINGKQGGDVKQGQAKPEVEGRRLRKRVSYNVDGDDDEWFDRLQHGDFDAQPGLAEQVDLGREFHYKHAGMYPFGVVTQHAYRPLVSSQKGQLNETTKYDHATAQSVLTSLSLRLAVGSGYS